MSFNKNKDGCNKAIDAIRTKWPEPPLDGPAFVRGPKGVHAITDGSSTTAQDIMDNSNSWNGDWTEYGPCPGGSTKEPVPQGLLHRGWHGRVKATWKLSNSMLNDCPNKHDYLDFCFSRGPSVGYQFMSFSIRESTSVHQLDGEQRRTRWSLCILPVEMLEPDERAAEFIFAWLPSMLIVVCFRASLDSPMSNRDLIYSKGYYLGWYKFPVVNSPKETKSHKYLFSHDLTQDFPFELPHHT